MTGLPSVAPASSQATRASFINSVVSGTSNSSQVTSGLPLESQLKSDVVVNDNRVRLSNGDFVDLSFYNTLSEYNKALLTRDGVDKFNAQQNQIQQNFLQNNVKLDDGTYVAKAEFNALSKDNQSQLKTLGVKGYNDKITSANLSPGHSTGETETTILLPPALSIRLDDGTYVGMSDYNKLSYEQQQDLKTLGVTAFNAKQSANIDTSKITIDSSKNIVHVGTKDVNLDTWNSASDEQKFNYGIAGGVIPSGSQYIPALTQQDIINLVNAGENETGITPTQGGYLTPENIKASTITHDSDYAKSVMQNFNENAANLKAYEASLPPTLQAVYNNVDKNWNTGYAAVQNSQKSFLNQISTHIATSNTDPSKVTYDLNAIYNDPKISKQDIATFMFNGDNSAMQVAGMRLSDKDYTTPSLTSVGTGTKTLTVLSPGFIGAPSSSQIRYEDLKSEQKATYDGQVASINANTLKEINTALNATSKSGKTSMSPQIESLTNAIENVGLWDNSKLGNTTSLGGRIFYTDKNGKVLTDQQQVAIIWNSLPDTQKAQVASAYGQNPNKINSFAELTYQEQQSASQGGVIGQMIWNPLTGITTPFADLSIGQHVTASQWENAAVTGLMDVSMVGGMNVLKSGSLFEDLIGSSKAASFLTGGLATSAAIINVPNTITTVTSPTTSFGQKAFAIGSEGMIADWGLSSLGITTPATFVQNNIIPKMSINFSNIGKNVVNYTTAMEGGIDEGITSPVNIRFPKLMTNIGGSIKDAINFTAGVTGQSVVGGVTEGLANKVTYIGRAVGTAATSTASADLGLLDKPVYTHIEDMGSVFDFKPLTIEPVEGLAEHSTSTIAGKVEPHEFLSIPQDKIAGIGNSVPNAIEQYSSAFPGGVAEASDYLGTSKSSLSVAAGGSTGDWAGIWNPGENGGVSPNFPTAPTRVPSGTGLSLSEFMKLGRDQAVDAISISPLVLITPNLNSINEPMPIRTPEINPIRVPEINPSRITTTIRTPSTQPDIQTGIPQITNPDININTEVEIQSLTGIQPIVMPSTSLEMITGIQPVTIPNLNTLTIGLVVPDISTIKIMDIQQEQQQIQEAKFQLETATALDTAVDISDKPPESTERNPAFLYPPEKKKKKKKLIKEEKITKNSYTFLFKKQPALELHYPTNNLNMLQHGSILGGQLAERNIVEVEPAHKTEEGVKLNQRTYSRIRGNRSNDYRGIRRTALTLA